MLDYEKIGLFLSNERKKEKLTQKQLAGKLNITFQAVSRWEKGISVPSLDVLDDLSRIFNVSIDEILKGERFNMRFSYEKAGVDVKKVDIINKKAKDFVEMDEYNPSFRGGIYDLKKYLTFEHPIIVSRVLEPGSKQRIAIEYGYIEELIQDIFLTLINDILATGANPLFITNTIISSHENIDLINKIVVLSYAEAKKYDIKILKGQYSIKPKVVYPGEYLIDTEMIGIADYKKMINYKNITNGDSILYIESNGIHHHGFSLVDKLLEEFPEIKKESIGGIEFMDEIMKPPYCYYSCLKELIEKEKIHGLVNVAGFGMARSVERIIPNGFSAQVDLNKIKIPTIFKCLRKYLNVDDLEMLNTFNCGIGYIVIVSSLDENMVLKHINKYYTCNKIGCIKKGTKKIKFNNSLKW